MPHSVSNYLKARSRTVPLRLIYLIDSGARFWFNLSLLYTNCSCVTTICIYVTAKFFEVNPVGHAWVSALPQGQSGSLIGGGSGDMKFEI